MAPIATYSLLALLVVLAAWLVFHLRKPETRATPLDLITTPDTGRLSAAKVGQLVGLIVSTWVIITLTTKDSLSLDLFLCYLTYVAGVDLFGKFLRWKSSSDSTASEEPLTVAEVKSVTVTTTPPTSKKVKDAE